MTAITRDPGATRARPGVHLRDLVRSRADEPAWVLPSFLGVTALSAVLYLWNLAANGYANTYYSAAVLAASKSWSAWFFGSLDAGNFITVDKPPLSTMLMGLSVRVFGLSSWSILLPQALAGVLTVALLFLIVRRSFGPVAAVIAGVVMALTPAAVLIFRFNNPDALLTLLLVAGAWALLRALDHGSLRWTALAAALVGFAFLTKYLEAYLVLPGFALVYLVSASASLRRRIAGLLVAAATVVAASGWWVAIVQAIPLGSRPFIGGSTTGSPLDLIFGYDGLGRIFGGSGPGGGGGGGFGGTAGLFRLFNSEFFGQIAWLIPLALASLAVGLWLRRRAGRTDRALAGYLLWGSTLLTQALVFSFMSGVIHSYYAAALAPGIAVLVGAGLADLWALRSRTPVGAIALGAAFIGTALWGMVLLERTPDFMPALGPAAVALAAVASAALLVASTPRLRTTLGRAAPAAAALGLVAALLAPAAYSLATVQTSVTGSDPHPGPASATFDAGGAGGGFGGFAGGFAGSGAGTAPNALAGGTPPARALPAAPSQASGGFGGGAGPGTGSADSALVSYLVAHQGNATWIVAVSSAQSAASIELQTGLPVMGMGGFTGSDPAPTLAQLQQYIASGKLRYVLVGGGGGGGFGGPGGQGGAASSVSSWVTSTCTAVDYSGSGSSSLYDCAGAAS